MAAGRGVLYDEGLLPTDVQQKWRDGQTLGVERVGRGFRWTRTREWNVIRREERLAMRDLCHVMCNATV